MTEATSQNKQILEKLDHLTKSVSGIKEDIAGINQRIEYQPRIDSEAHKAIDHRFKYDDDRIKKLEDTQTWGTRSIIFLALTSLVSLVLALYK